MIHISILLVPLLLAYTNQGDVSCKVLPVLSTRYQVSHLDCCSYIISTISHRISTLSVLRTLYLVPGYTHCKGCTRCWYDVWRNFVLSGRNIVLRMNHRWTAVICSPPNEDIRHFCVFRFFTCFFLETFEKSFIITKKMYSLIKYIHNRVIIH